MAAATNAAHTPYGPQEHVNMNKIIKAELKDYLSLPPVQMRVELLPWWAQRESRFPHLAELAADLHAPPGSCAALERTFSQMADKIISCHKNIVREVFEASCMARTSGA